ncbi:MAG TPA: hypothetical protein VES73_18395 [Lamprocystis sp. (in: g-proteobacteria)]|nr:hypothetical protein [Lamprocystis sp. (in: g-proteobacteria)]
MLRGNPEGVLDCAGRAAAHWQQANAGARERAVVIRLRGLGHQLAKDYPAAIADWHEALARQGRGAEGRCHAERAVALFTDLRSPDLAEAQAALAECRA